jgi:predicted Zn-dependent peptidase
MTVQQTTLPNGLRVISEAMSGIESTSLGVWVNVGARSESAALNGISHMLEHMAFKGTRTRSALDIAQEIESVGGHLNAYTSREQTAYFARVLGDDVPLAVDILGDILLNSTFEAEEVERERGVILQEIGEAHDTPDDLVFDMLQEAAFPDQPVGRPILGTPDHVRSFNSQTLASYMTDQYRAKHMVFAAAGKVDHETLVAQISEIFDGLASAGAPEFQKATYQGGDRRVERPLEQVHLTLGFPGFSYDDDSFYAGQILSAILGGGMSSRLFQEVREKRGLAYSVYSFSGSLMDSGMFGIYAGTGPDQADELGAVIAQEVKKTCDGIGTDEFERARAQLKASTLMALESSGTRVEQFARQLFVFDRIMPMGELVEKLNAVTPDQVMAAANRLLTSGDISVAAVGPAGSLVDYDRLAGHFSR